MNNGNENVISGAQLRKQSRHYVTCPDSGNVYLMRRPNVTHLINSGVLPENFVAKTLTLLGKEVKEESTELTDKDLLNGEAVMQAMLKASMIKPRIVDRVEEIDEDADDAEEQYEKIRHLIEFYDIPPSDRQHLFLWAKGELPDVPLETTEGESVTVGAVESFPVPEAGGEPSGLSTDGERAGEESERSAEAA